MSKNYANKERIMKNVKAISSLIEMIDIRNNELVTLNNKHSILERYIATEKRLMRELVELWSNQEYFSLLEEYEAKRKKDNEVKT